MSQQKMLAIVISIPFSILSLYAVWEVGYIGIVDYHRHSPAGWQVFADLVIALLLLVAWMIPDARRSGRNPWPFVVLALSAGSFGPLLYLLTAGVRSGAESNSESSYKSN